ncbi:DUF1460 domain-containing protein [bacterium]|nr:DUF1460 domain-containing protein [bacterium]
MRLHLAVLAAVALLSGCATHKVTLTSDQLVAAEKAGISEERIASLEAKPLYKMTPAEVGDYVTYAHEAYPDLRERIVHLGRKNIGQPYELYLLGEFPYETYDSQPLYCLDKSDCVVFSEHTYAMALSDSWESFFWTLQRIRYRDGVIGVASRNHYTEADWNKSNTWLVTDVSGLVAGDAAATYKQKVNRAAFLKKRYKIERDIPVETITETYVPKEAVPAILDQLQSGDFVNVISGKDGGLYASHVGLVAVAEDGSRHFLHSSPPKVREQTFESYIAACEARDARNEAKGKDKAKLYGFKFLRLNDNPQVPPMPAQQVPGGG